jgi:hypothetical protein
LRSGDFPCIKKLVEEDGLKEVIGLMKIAIDNVFERPPD